jgi:hypothetical protein
MPEITLRHEVDTDEDTYWSKCVFDEAFNTQMYVDHLGIKWKLEEQHEDDAKITRRVHVEPPVGNLPGPVKKVIGDKLAYTEAGTFDKKTKKYSFKVTPSTMAEKTKVSGEMWCEKKGDKKVTRVCRISVEVKVMLVGGMVEERILSDLKTSYERGTVFTNEYIAKNGL